MEKWTYEKYSKPYLDIKSIQSLDNTLLITSAVDNFDIELSNNKDRLFEIKSVLDNLRDSSHPSWNKIKDNQNEIVSNLLTIFDEHTLILNADNTAQVIENQSTVIEYQINKTIKLLAGYIASNVKWQNEYLPLLINASAYQLKLLCEEIGIDFALQCSPNYMECANNFFITTILYQIKYLKTSHPLALLVWLVSLCKLKKLSLTDTSKIEKFICLAWKELALNWLGGAFNIKEIAIYQACLASHLINSTKENAAPIFAIDNIETHFPSPSSGINFMINIERLMDAILEKRGESLLFKKISGELNSDDSLVKGIFIEQYHVNRRFVEIITTLLNKRLTAPLRKRMFQYYEEENGHEAFELKTCLSLGISEDDLANAYPLPLMQAYVDAFTVVASLDPVGFFSSAMITEGMIGKPSPLYDLLEKIMINNLEYQRVARAHDNLNVDLNHAYLSRLFMGDIEFMTQASQQRAMKHVLYLLELNHRSLEQMTTYYSTQQALVLYRGTETGII